MAGGCSSRPTIELEMVTNVVRENGPSTGEFDQLATLVGRGFWLSLVVSSVGYMSSHIRTRITVSAFKGLVVFGAALAVGLVGLVVPAQAAPAVPSDVVVESEHEYVLEGVDEFAELADAVAVDAVGAGSDFAQVAGEYVLPVGLTGAFVPPAVPSFSDVPVGAPFFREIEWMAANGISTGYADGTFRPGNLVTRQAVAAFLYRLAGQNVTGGFVTPGVARFSDVPVTAPFFRQIEWMASVGISVGYPDGTFRPGGNVHRGAMAAFLYRFAGPDLTGGFVTPDVPSFSDVPVGVSFFRQIEWLAATGISTGYSMPDDTRQFRPGNPVTRQAMAAFLYRLSDLLDSRRIVQVDAGWTHSLALAVNGTLWAWGSNIAGRLGDGTTTNRYTLVQVRASWGTRLIVQVAAGDTHSLAVADDGTVWAWGSNATGRLGDGTTTTRRTPVQVYASWGTRLIVQVAAGDNHSLAVADDGTVWAWGSNADGRLGDGTTTNRHIPVQVNAASWGTRQITQVAAGRTHSLAVADDGTVWAWGSNARGRLGDGTIVDNSHTPVQVSTTWDSRRIIQATAGGGHSLAVADDGTLWAWGSNASGQLGDGTNIHRWEPVRVSASWGSRRITQAAAGADHSLAVAGDGTLWAWGWNACGLLGDGTTTYRRTPIQVRASWGSRRITQVAAGTDHSVAAADDGTPWAWGRNSSGQLGDGTTTDRHIPARATWHMPQETMTYGDRLGFN